ncbi:50S ribosomal protein L3 N(5)-glutamine methyltransferase [Parahaliea mediterranea]|uniref:50S ribosomal protein L3 N(5)-glutamine methyltransferase n=1 Tax=Parahaliea mediterranea TaxID=651086 RepID=UPI00321ADCB5
METVGEALQYCADQLEQSGVFFGHGCDNAWDEAVQLVLTVVELPLDADEGVLSHPVNRQQQMRLDELLTRRTEERAPLPYLLGRAFFAGLEFHCDERAIIPRSPIGELVRNAFQPWYAGPGPTRVLDLCCGGGAIGLATAHYFPACHVDLADLDGTALELAVENGELLEVCERVEFFQSDLYRALGRRRYDLILSNPPYVDARDLSTMPREYHHEPELALGSGADGLDVTRRILAGAAEHLEPHGLLVVEVGNSWEALEAAYPDVPFTWLEFEHGGHGVFALTARELREYSASLA